jgi:hypothetical protein
MVEWMDGWVDGWMDEWMDGWMKEIGEWIIAGVEVKSVRAIEL